MTRLFIICVCALSVLLNGCIFVSDYSSCNDPSLWDEHEVSFNDYEVYDGCFIKADHIELVSDYYCMYDYVYRRDRRLLYDKYWNERIEFEDKGDSYPIRSCYECQCGTQF